MVWMRGVEWPLSTFERRRLTCVSTTFVWGSKIQVPDFLQQHRAGHDLVGVLHEILEQSELARLQVDGPARPLRTSRASRSISRFSTQSEVAGAAWRGRPAPGRPHAQTSSDKANGFTR